MSPPACVHSFGHREYRVPGILSSRPNWVPPTPSPTRECCSSPPFGSKGADTLACGRGVGGPDSDEGTDTLVLYVYYCAAGFALLDLPKGKSLGRSKPATNSSNEQAH
jgi:hypothetical protein